MESADTPAIGPIARLLGVRAGEVETVKQLFGLAFQLGAALVLFYTAANAIFLTRYDIGVLPWVYIANAVAVIVVGVAYGAWSARATAAAALTRLNVLMAVTVAGLWLWATVSDGRAVAFLMAMWFRLLFIYAVLGLWEIASAVFDVRQAKRLFASVALGMMMAFVVGGALAPVLGSVVGPTNMVGLSAVFLVGYAVRFARMAREGAMGAGAGAAATPAGLREIMSDPTSRLMAWMRWVTVLLVYATEFVFYEQATATFETEGALAGFLGVFLGTTTLVMVVVTGLVSGRYISHHGIRVALLTLPIGMLLVAVPAGLYGTFVAVDTAFFALVCVTLLVNNVLDHGIATPAGAVLFQPMEPSRRIRIRLAIDGWLGSLSLAASGGLLLILDALDLDSVAPVLFLVVIFAVGGVVVAVRQYDDYVDALRRVTSLAFGSWGSGRGGPLEAETIHRLVGPDSPATSLAGAGLGRALDENPLGPITAELLDHPVDDVVALALGAVGGAVDRSHSDAVARVVVDPARPVDLRRKALDVLAELDVDVAASRVDAEPGLFASIAPSVLARHPQRHGEAAAAIDALIGSDAAQDRIDVCTLLEPDSPLLDLLLADAEPSVVDAALDRLGGHADERRLATLFDRARDHRHHPRAAAALGRVDGAVPAMTRTQRERLSPTLLAGLVVRFHAGHDEAAAVIDELLDDPFTPLAVRAAAFAAAADERVRPARNDWLTDDDIARPARLAVAHASLAEACPSVAIAVDEDFEMSRRLILSALGVSDDSRRLDDIALLIRRGSEDDRANAIEALDVSLGDPRRRAIVAILEPVGIGDVVVGGDMIEPPEVALDRLVGDATASSWTRWLAAAARTEHPVPEERAPVPSQPGMPSQTEIDTVLMLKRIEVFSTLSFDALAELANEVRHEHFAAGAVIIEEGAVDDELFAVTHGTVAVSVDGTVVRQQGEGSVFGELAVIDPAPRSATVTAVTEVEAAVVSRRVLVALADRRPEVMTEIARVLAQRLRA